MTEQPQRFFEFEDFLLDSQQRLLFRDGEPVNLTPKVFDILLELIQRSGQVVQKKELMESIWPDSFVEESNLTQHISTLRKKLGQDSAQSRYIQTVPGRGYRFVAPIKSWDDDAVVTVEERVRSRVTISDSGQPSVQPAVEMVRTSQRLLPEPSKQTLLRRYRTPLLILGVLLIAGIAIVAYRLFRRPPVAPFSRTKPARFTTSGKVEFAAISPDGKHVAYAEDDEGGESLWIRQVATSNLGVKIVDTTNRTYNGITFSPDNDYIYFVAQEINSPSILYRLPSLGGKPTKLIDDVDSPPTFSPDGKQIAFLRGYPDASETDVIVANADGSGERKLSTSKGPKMELKLGPGPSWSPDGQNIALSVSVYEDSGEHNEVFTADVKDGRLKQLTNIRWSSIGRIAWASDGKGLLTTASDSETGNSQVWFISFPSGQPRRVTNDLSDYRALSLTADSHLLALVQSDQRTNVWVATTPDGKGATQITSTNYDGVEGLSWTPDGSLLYSAALNGLQDIWLIDSQGKQRTQLTENAGQNVWPVMSPDGQWIVFASTRSGRQQLWRMDKDGSHIQRLTNGVHDLRPAFSPDGKWIVYLGLGDSGNQMIAKIPANGGTPVYLVNEGLPGSPALSPDGKTMAFTYRRPALAKVRLALTSFESPGPIEFLESQGLLPRRLLLHWMPDGQSLVFIKIGGSVSNLWQQSINHGAPSPLTTFDSDVIYNFAIAPDGHIAVSRGHESNDVVLIRSND